MRVHGKATIRAYNQSDCLAAHSKGCCVPPRYLSLLPEASWACHVPSQAKKRPCDPFVTLLYACDLYLAIKEASSGAWALRVRPEQLMTHVVGRPWCLTYIEVTCYDTV